jgi:hypothetical protein
MLDKIIFGDNQFFGINHMSEDKAMAQTERFRDLDAIIEVIDCAYDAGIHAFMFNTHGRVADICDHIRANPTRYSDFRLYPSMPYAHKYATAVADKGIFGAIKDVILAENSAGELMEMFARGGMSLFERDMMRVMKILVDMEMKMFRGLDVKVIFLQNIVTDMLLGFGIQEPFSAFADYVKTRYGAQPGFVTMNLPRAAEHLRRCGVDNPVICSAINAGEFNMSPDRESYEATLAAGGFQPMAMSVLASGALSADAAIRYVASLPNMQSIVFGASSRRNILETKAIIDQYMK